MENSWARSSLVLRGSLLSVVSASVDGLEGRSRSKPSRPKSAAKSGRASVTAGGAVAASAVGKSRAPKPKSSSGGVVAGAAGGAGVSKVAGVSVKSKRLKPKSSSSAGVSAAGAGVGKPKLLSREKSSVSAGAGAGAALASVAGVVALSVPEGRSRSTRLKSKLGTASCGLSMLSANWVS